MNTFETPIVIRAYTERPGRVPLGCLPRKAGLTASKWTVIFDCETTIDATQQLRVGFFQIRKRDALESHGLLFEPNAVTEAEEQLIRQYADTHDISVLTVAQFRKEVLLKYGYTRHASIVGFNLPFDLSRIALSHGNARRDKRGGYSFLLTRNKEDPRIRAKHLSPRAAMIDFSKPGEQDTPRGMRKRGKKVETFRGHFVDIKTLGSALLSRRFSLRTLAQALQTPTQKHETDEHGDISEAYLDYAQADVQLTWECYQVLGQRYDQHGLSQATSKILSEASIGKAYLQKMGIRPFLGCDPTFDRGLLGKILCGYYGGRAEVRIRREICEIMYCDFKSMYPTVNALMGLWEFVTADGIQHEDTTAETQQFLESITVSDLQNPVTWRNLTTIVRVKPNSDLFPVRAKYDGKTNTIGLNYLTGNSALWFTLADCIVSKLLTGKSPSIEEAITFRPGNRQSDLQPVKIMGRDDYEIDPAKDDLFTRLIDLRDEAKAKGDSIENTLKIIANSTSYGIFIEINRDDAPKAELLHVYGPKGAYTEVHSKAIEEPGRFFNPLLGVLITGAARLMLGIAEKLTVDGGLDWAFCDTDSLAITRPDNLPRAEFRKRTKKVIDWFVPLNPYKKPGSILQLENINCGIGSNELEPLYCFAISAKRYALFNLDTENNPILRKASAHGLGHLIELYADEDAPPELPMPRVPLGEIGVRRWQHDLWLQIIQAALDGHPDQVSLDWHPALSQPAAQRYSASSPHLLAWLDSWNADKPYDEQVRPFGFLLSYTARTGVFAEPPELEASVVDDPKRGRPPKAEDLKPIAPYGNDPARTLPNVFDRVSGEPIAPDKLKTYAEALCQYHLSSEDKFQNGYFLDHGRTERRHVVAKGIVLIGKEANRIGESGEPDPVSPAVQEFESNSALSGDDCPMD
jgi:hypothetical protein